MRNIHWGDTESEKFLLSFKSWKVLLQYKLLSGYSRMQGKGKYPLKVGWGFLIAVKWNAFKLRLKSDFKLSHEKRLTKFWTLLPCYVICIVYSSHPTPNSVKHPGPSTTCVTTLQLARFINRPKVNLDTRQSEGESTRINETRAQSMNLGLEQDRLKVQYFPFQMTGRTEFYHLVLEVNRRPTINNSYYWREIV